MPSTLELTKRAPALIKKLSTDRTASQHKAAPPPQLLQSATIQRALANPHSLTAAEVPQLQRMMGNEAVSNLLGRDRSRQEGAGGLRVGASNDAHERQARQVAAEVGGYQSVPRSSAPASEATEAPEIGAEGGVVNRSVETTIQAARSAGRPVPEHVRLAMEKQTGDSYQGVQVHAGQQANKANRALGARAFTQGKHIYLGRNQSPYNVQLMAHELTHTTQQGVGGSGVADIQRDDEEDRKKVKKLNKKISGTKAKKGFAKVGKGILNVVDWLVTAPARLIDHASVLDLHLKDFGNFVQDGKTRKERAGGNSSSMKYHEGTKRRRAGRTGLRALLSGVNIHTKSARPYIPGLHSMFNPFLAMGTGQASAKNLGKGYDKDLEKMRDQKQNIRNRMNQNNQPVPLGNDVGNDLGNDIGNNTTGNEVDEEVVNEITSNVVEEEELNN